jgi:hypothetical protein
MHMKTSDPKEYIGETQLYTPSFIDRFMRFIQRLPLPYWMTYLLLFTLQVTIFHILSWIDGWIPRFTFNSMALIFPLWQWLTLMIVTYLNSVALEALSNFSPLLKLDEENLKKLKYEFTHMPPLNVILNAMFWAIIYIAVTMSLKPLYAALGIGSALTTTVIIEGLICYCTGSVIYYHSIRQLLLVNRTVKLVGHFNLFRLEPVYAFSRLTAQTGISWMLLLSLTILVFPLKLANVVILGIFFAQILMAIAAFVLPLWVVHHRLLLEKRKLLAEHRHRVEAAFGQLHHALDEKKEDEASQLSNILLGLNIEREVLGSIPTWPWRESTLTGFASAIVLPIILLLVQIAIQKWLAG